MIAFDQLHKQISDSQNILLLCHQNPDGDTLGAAGALAFFISSAGHKKACIHCPDALPENFQFLKIKKFFTSQKPVLSDFDLLIFIDCADPRRSGLPAEFEEVKEKIYSVNIDHHATNPSYANLNIIEAQASSTCEIIYNFFRRQNMAISPEISTCLMTGIVTDTSFFTNKATSAIATAASSHLLNCGVNLKEVINNTWKNQSLESLKIWGEILSKLQFNPKYKIATSVIIPQSTVNYSVFEGLANFLTAIYEADIILVLIQMDEQTIKGSLRTTKDNVDVARLAKVWGGGGHAKAAGFSLKGKLVREDNCWKVR